MAKDSRKVSSEEAIRVEEATTLETLIRRRARGLIDAIVEEELAAALGAAESARVGAARQGYRHGTRERKLTTSLGPTTFAMPRARVRTAEGATAEWRSELVPRYQRRSERVDEAILGVYLSGTNTRRIKGALAPLLRGGPLSKDAVSRLVGRLADDFETWRRRDLAEDQIQYLLMDGWYPKVRIGKRRVRVPVPRHYRGWAKIIDVGVAARHSTADARRRSDGHCGRIRLVDAQGPPARESCPASPVERPRSFESALSPI
jgi:putative transposase